MGQIDDEERQYLIIDKDTGKVYDVRNERHVARITKEVTTTPNKSNDLSQEISNNGAWKEWWKEKRNNDQNFLAAAENG